MKLGGWQRLWLLLLAIWLPFAVWQFSVRLETPSTAQNTVTSIFLVGMVLVLVLFPLAFAGNWVRRGFMQPKSK
jgi:uncharacterized membrane protein